MERIKSSLNLFQSFAIIKQIHNRRKLDAFFRIVSSRGFVNLPMLEIIDNYWLGAWLSWQTLITKMKIVRKAIKKAIQSVNYENWI